MALVEQETSNRADLAAAHLKVTKALADLQATPATRHQSHPPFDMVSSPSCYFD
jgi:hypothetical protein